MTSLSPAPFATRLRDVVASGNCVLFLGAGASIDSGAPTGQQLSDELAADFFGFPAGDFPLDEIAGFIDAEAGRRELNLWLVKRFGDLTPSKTLELLPTFCWKAIYTVNFDTLVEQAYQRSGGNIQRLHPLYSNRDPVGRMGQDEVPFYKLHGCLTRANAEDGQLVLTQDDFARVELSRERLFNRLVDDAADFTILYVGFRRADPDFARVLASVQSAVGGLTALSRSYALQPGFLEVEAKRAELKKVTLINASADAFFSRLDREVPEGERRCSGAVTVPSGSALSARRPDVGGDLVSRLERDYEILDDALAHGSADVDAFFDGSPPDWGVVARNADAERDVQDSILEAVLVDPDADRAPAQFFLIHAEAGAGKTTLLRRVGAELLHTWDRIVLSLKPFGALEFLDLEALAKAAAERVYVLIDDVVRVSAEVRALLAAARRAGVKLTVIGEARTNEWREGQESQPVPTADEFELGALSSAEIDHVLDRLAEHRKLGYLLGATREQQREAFETRAQKQLLVALREATEGRAFDEIVVDEYQRIPSPDAQRAYLFVASLHRFNLVTRAAVLHRALGIPLVDLGDRVFGPAQKIIVERELAGDLEPYYTTRHPLIAEIVFDRLVHRESERAEFYIDAIRQLDIGYSSDLETYRQLSRSLNRRLLSDFSSGSAKRNVMNEITAVDPQDPFVHQHAAMMELGLGNFRTANEHIARAIELRPADAAIRDTQGRILLASARMEGELRRKRSRLDEAAAIFARNIARRPDEPYGYRHLAETYWEKYLAETDENRRVDSLGAAYQTLLDGIETCPSGSMLLQYRADLEERLGSYEDARSTLREAISHRPSDVTLHVMAARLASEAGRNDEAAEILKAGLVAAPEAWELHYRLGRLLADTGQATDDDVTHHFSAALLAPLRRYKPRLSYAVWLFAIGKYDEANEQFERLSELDLPVREKKDLRRFSFKDLGSRHQGRVTRISYESGDIEYDRGATRVFFWLSEVEAGARNRLQIGTDLTYEIQFNLRGPQARSIRVVRSAHPH